MATTMYPNPLKVTAFQFVLQLRHFAGLFVHYVEDDRGGIAMHSGRWNFGNISSFVHNVSPGWTCSSSSMA